MYGYVFALTLIAALLLVVLGFAVVRASLNSNSDLVSGLGLLAFIAVMAASLMLGAFSIITPVSAFEARVKCDRYEENLNRETRFVRHHIGAWDCLVQTEQGWLPIERVLKVES